jgi:hypothetical protein
VEIIAVLLWFPLELPGLKKGVFDRIVVDREEHVPFLFAASSARFGRLIGAPWGFMMIGRTLLEDRRCSDNSVTRR